MSQQPFQKFINPKNNAAIKEKYKQEKKKAKKERAAAIEKHFEERRAARTRGFENKPEKKVDKRQKYPQKKKEIPSKTSFTAASEKKNTAFAEMPLNKFIAHCGVTSRRDAVTLITEGKITVNKKVITGPAFRVNEKDDVLYNGKKLFITKYSLIFTTDF